MVEVEVRKSNAGSENTTTTTLDVNEIVSRVRDFVDSIKEMKMGGQRMAVSVEGFNFSVGKEGKQYDLSLNVNLSFKPKASESETEVEAEQHRLMSLSSFP